MPGPYLGTFNGNKWKQSIPILALCYMQHMGGGRDGQHSQEIQRNPRYGHEHKPEKDYNRECSLIEMYREIMSNMSKRHEWAKKHTLGGGKVEAQGEHGRPFTAQMSVFPEASQVVAFTSIRS